MRIAGNNPDLSSYPEHVQRWIEARLATAPAIPGSSTFPPARQLAESQRKLTADFVASNERSEGAAFFFTNESQTEALVVGPFVRASYA
jgi:hypothetical protein